MTLVYGTVRATSTTPNRWPSKVRNRRPPTLPSSILYRPDDGPDPTKAGPLPAFAVDLHLDEIAAAFGHDRPDVPIGPWAFTRLHDPDAVAFRHEVFRDLEAPRLREGLADFVTRIGVVQAHLTHAASIAHPYERDRWLVEAMDRYQAAVKAVVATLDEAPCGSRALAAVTEAVRTYVGSPDFTEFAAATARILDDLGAVTYRLRIGESRVLVQRHDGEADFGAEVLATFARFRGSAEPEPIPVDVFRTVDMNVVEIGILERVARLHPAVFQALGRHVARYETFVEPGVAAFAAELPFYLGWLDLIGPLEAAGLPFCYPAVSRDGGGLAARGLFDLALAIRRIPAGDEIVTSDLGLSDADTLLVITGANQSGKTAFARAIGQVHHLAAIGVPVPGSEARVPLGGPTATLFARTEDPTDLTGRLESELLRARAILDGLQAGTVVVMNESFASTTVDDALALNRALIGEMRQRGAMCILVTFLSELAVDGPGTETMTSVMDPIDPTRPTFRFERRPADPLAHARAVAQAHGLGYDAVRARIRAATVR